MFQCNKDLKIKEEVRWRKRHAATEIFLGVEQDPFFCHSLSPGYTPVTAVDSGVPIFKLQV